MRTMLNKTLLTVAACLMAMVFTAPAQAQHHLGICTEWNPDFGTFDCDLATPGLQIGSTSDETNPSFSIAANDGTSYTNVVLLVLVPDDPSVVLTASFNSATAVSPDGSYSFVENNLLFASMPNDLSILSQLYDEPIEGGVDWHFNSIGPNISVVPVTEYTVIVFETGEPVLGKNATGGPVTITVDITGTLPIGSIFMVYGLNTSTSWSVDTSNPLTLGLQVVPEPASAILLFPGLVGLLLMRKRKMDSQ